MFVLIILTTTAFIGTLVVFLKPSSDICNIPIGNNTDGLQPLILQNLDDKLEYVYPTDGNHIVLNKNDEMIFGCPKQSILVGSTEYNEDKTFGLCRKNKFYVFGQTISCDEIKCSQKIVPTVKPSNSTWKCEKNLLDIGYEFKDRTFIRSISVCFDNKTKLADYSVMLLNNNIKARQLRNTSFQDSFYENQCDAEYVNQKKVINGLVGLPSLSNRYINKVNYLTKSQLSTEYDFIYESEQRTTYFRINVAPQWNNFNRGNWKTLSENIRDYVSKSDIEHIIFTGTHGLATLTHYRKGTQIDISLCNKTMFVPAFLWKILYEPESQRALGFVIVNNPYVDHNKSVCNDICGKYEWITWNHTNKTDGYGYCCDVRELSYFHEIPEFPVSGLL